MKKLVLIMALMLVLGSANLCLAGDLSLGSITSTISSGLSGFSGTMSNFGSAMLSNPVSTLSTTFNTGSILLQNAMPTQVTQAISSITSIATPTNLALLTNPITAPLGLASIATPSLQTLGSNTINTIKSSSTFQNASSLVSSRLQPLTSSLGGLSQAKIEIPKLTSFADDLKGQLNFVGNVAKVLGGGLTTVMAKDLSRPMAVAPLRYAGIGLAGSAVNIPVSINVNRGSYPTIHGIH